VQLKLTTAYNPKVNDKIERGHLPIINALVKACRRKPKIWPRVISFSLWIDRTTHNSVTSYMPVELMHGQKSMMPRKRNILTWMFFTWKNEINREKLLELRIQQVKRLSEDLRMALEKFKIARLSNKEQFDKTHRLRVKTIEEGDRVLVFDSTYVENQHNTVQIFSRKWFGPYVVVKVYNISTYLFTLRIRWNSSTSAYN